MTLLQWLGLCLISLPFIGIAIVCYVIDGWKCVGFVLGFGILTAGLIVTGVTLLIGNPFYS